MESRRVDDSPLKQNGNLIVNPKFLGRFVLAFTIGTCLLSRAPAYSADLVAGAAKVDITPPIGFPMWGYGNRHADKCVGVLDPLQARALVLTVGGKSITITVRSAIGTR